MKKLIALIIIALANTTGFFVMGSAVIVKNTEEGKTLEITSPIDVTIDTEYLRDFFGEIPESSEVVRSAYE